MGVFHIGMGFFSAHAVEFPLQATRCAVPFVQSAALRFDGQDPWILEIALQCDPQQKQYNIVIQYTQMLHVWNIYLRLGYFWGKCR